MWIVDKIQEKVILPLRQACAIGGITMGVALGVVSVVGGTYLQIKGLGLFSIPCLALGCFLSGSVFAYYIKKTVDLAKKSSLTEEDEFKAKYRALETEKKVLEDERLRLERENQSRIEKIAELKGETRRLKMQKIDINAFMPILELSLAKANMTIKDVCTKWKKEKDDIEEGMLSKIGLDSPKCKQYIGIYQTDFEAKFGIDMKKIKVKERGDKISVSGIEVENTGIKNQKDEWILRELQTFDVVKRREVSPEEKNDPKDTSMGFVYEGWWYEKNLQGEVKTSLDLNEISPDSERQSSDLQTRINAASCEQFVVAKDYVRKMAMEIIKYFLSPIAKARDLKIEFLDGSFDGGEDGMSLIKYVTDYNSNIEKKLSNSVVEVEADAVRKVS